MLQTVSPSQVSPPHAFAPTRHPPATMQAAVLVAPHTIRMEQVPVPQPGPGQVRVRIEGCGVCASNVHPWEGPEWMKFPTEPGGLGHEGWGVVDAVGPDVGTVKTGDRVTTLFQNSFAEYDVGDVDAVIKLPGSMNGKPFPGEPLGCAMNILRRSDIKAGHRVAIIGIGFLGAILTRLATQAGADVIAVSRRQASLDLGRAMGAAATVAMDDHAAVVGKVNAITSGLLCDRVIEATGKQWPLDLAGDLVREGGRLVIAGYHQDGSRQINMQQWNWKGIDVINAHERDRQTCVDGVKEAVAAVRAGLLFPEPLFTHTYTLSDLDKALEATRNHPDNFVKALVVMG